MKNYSNPSSFKEALEAKLRVKSGGGPNFERARQLVVFDRFLARIVRVFGDAVILKGGLALEMRMHGVRTTKDVDLSVSGSRDVILEKLQASGRLDLGEYFVFEVGEDPVHRRKIFLTSLVSHRRSFKSIRSKRTLPKSCMPTPCRDHAPTHE